MIIGTCTNSASGSNPLDFVRNSKKADFSFQNEECLIGMMKTEEGHALPMSVRTHLYQVHVTAHFPQSIPGSAAFLFCEHVLHSNADAFGFWVDPSDGELKLIAHLEEYDADHLDEVISSMGHTIDKLWPMICWHAEHADAMSKKEKEKYSLINLLPLFAEEDE